MIIVTGASDNHYLTLINMINSFVHHAYEKNSLIVYNLGLTEENWVNIQSKFQAYAKITYKIFDYSQYPSWFNINVGAGQYAWKPTIIYNTFLENKGNIILWMDAGNLINPGIAELENVILKNNIYTGTSSGTIKDWTHPLTLQNMGCTWVHEQNRNGACIGFNTAIDFVWDFLLEFYSCAQNKDCIFPEGSSRRNHRQDQAVLTVLFYKYKAKYHFGSVDGGCWKNHIGYSIHNDVEPHWDK